MGGSGAGLRASNPLGSLQLMRGESEYFSPFPTPSNKEEANEIARYQFRIGAWEGLPETPAELIHTQDIDISKLSTNQGFVRRDTLEYFVNNRLEPSNILDAGSRPFVIKNGNTYMIMDGNHRASYAKIIGRKKIKVDILDLADIKKRM